LAAGWRHFAQAAYARDAAGMASRGAHGRVNATAAVCCAGRMTGALRHGANSRVGGGWLCPGDRLKCLLRRRICAFLSINRRALKTCCSLAFASRPHIFCACELAVSCMVRYAVGACFFPIGKSVLLLFLNWYDAMRDDSCLFTDGNGGIYLRRVATAGLAATAAQTGTRWRSITRLCAYLLSTSGELNMVRHGVAHMEMRTPYHSGKQWTYAPFVDISVES